MYSRESNRIVKIAKGKLKVAENEQYAPFRALFFCLKKRFNKNSSEQRYQQQQQEKEIGVLITRRFRFKKHEGVVER